MEVTGSVESSILSAKLAQQLIKKNEKLPHGFNA
jgi:hypothetical protein